MHRRTVCQEQGKHRIQMFSTAKQGFNNPSSYSDHTRCLDTCNPYFSPYSHHKSHIPRKAYGDYPHSTTTTCTKATNSLQCHFGKFLPASKVWNTHLKCKCFLGSGKHMCYQHHCPTFLCLATYGKQSQWFGPPTSCHPYLSIPVCQIYEHLLNSSQCLTPFNMKPSDDSDTFWSPFSHPGIYVSALGSVLPLGVVLFCCYYFWCQPATSAHQPLQSGKMQYAIVDDNVEDAPIYRCEGKAPKPTRPHENHGLAMEYIPTWSESCQKPQLKSFAVPAQGSLVKSSKIQGMQECT